MHGIEMFIVWFLYREIICLIIMSWISNHSAQIEIIDDEPLREVIETLGGWPVTTPGWNESNENVPNLEKLIAMLKRKFTLGVLLEEWIGPDDKHSEDNVIQVGIWYL